MEHLGTYAQNIYSQFGEDGIIKELLDRIEAYTTLNRWCVEFGAWDGVFLSNTCNLIRNRGYRAVMIEGESERIIDLNRNHPSPDVIKICEFVTLEGEKSLDQILSRTEIPNDFDVLSVDIDGCDYWVVESLRLYTPKVIVVEFNPTIPRAVDFVQQPDFGVKQGCSAAALTRLATQKGYGLVAMTHCNLIFVLETILERISDGVTSAHNLMQLQGDQLDPVYAFSGYDGALFLSRELQFPWHGFSLQSGDLQPLPRLFRTFPGDWGRVRSALWRVYRRIFLKGNRL